MKSLKPSQFKQAQARKQQRQAAKLGAIVQAAEAEAPVEFLRQHIYFVAYLHLQLGGNRYGNLVVRVPGPLNSTSRLRTVEQMVAESIKAQQAPSGIVGAGLPEVVVTCVSDLGAQDVPITPAMREKIRAVEAAREQAEAAAAEGEDGPHEEAELRNGDYSEEPPSAAVEQEQAHATVKNLPEPSPTYPEIE